MSSIEDPASEPGELINIELHALAIVDSWPGESGEESVGVRNLGVGADDAWFSSNDSNIDIDRLPPVTVDAASSKDHDDLDQGQTMGEYALDLLCVPKTKHDSARGRPFGRRDDLGISSPPSSFQTLNILSKICDNACIAYFARSSPSVVSPEASKDISLTNYSWTIT